MREVLAIAGPTPEGGGANGANGANSANGVKEWCINTAAVDPLTRSVLANSEDGCLYRWDLASNRFTQRVQLTSGVAESYTPIALGADEAVYAINNAVLFCGVLVWCCTLCGTQENRWICRRGQAQILAMPGGIARICNNATGAKTRLYMPCNMQQHRGWG